MILFLWCYMKKYIDNFRKDLEEKIKNNYKFTTKEIEYIDIKIRDFQHERLIHLLVTLFYAIFAILFIVLSFFLVYFVIICFILLIFLFFYVKHYFYLENSVQYLYTLYDKIILNKEK